MTGKVSAVQGEVTQPRELRLDPIQPGTVKGHVGEFNIVGRGPVADPAIGPGGPVRTEIIQDDRDPHLRRMQ